MSDTSPMTPEEFEQKMREILTGHDPEVEHGEADDVMCDLLESLGYGDGAQVFREATTWTA